jgi:hypothetical protein
MEKNRLAVARTIERPQKNDTVDAAARPLPKSRLHYKLDNSFHRPGVDGKDLQVT